MTTKQTGKKFAPTLAPDLLGAVCMAVVVHALLLVVLSIEMQWTRATTTTTMEAELWPTLPPVATIEEAEHAAEQTDAVTPLNVVVSAPLQQQLSPRIVVEQETDSRDSTKQLRQDQQEQKRRKMEALRLRALEEEQSRDETVRDPT